MIITVAHQKGGVGKSTVACNLAISLEADIVDLDAQHSCVLFNLLRTSRGLAELKVLPVDTEGDLQAVLRAYSEPGKRLVVDSGGYDSNLNRLALAPADVIITPIGTSQIEVFGLQKFRNVLKEASEYYGKPIVARCLINNADSRSVLAIQALQRYIEENSEHFELLETVFHDLSDFKRSYGEGKNVIEMNPSGKAAWEVVRLTRELSDILRSNGGGSACNKAQQCV